MLRVEGVGLRREGHWDLRKVTFAIQPGEAWGVVGESGAGKSTLLSLVLGLVEPTECHITLKGSPWSPLSERDRRPPRPRIQAVLRMPWPACHRIARAGRSCRSLWRSGTGKRVSCDGQLRLAWQRR